MERAIKFLDRMDPPAGTVSVDVSTGTLGRGRVVVGERAIHVTWPDVRLERLRRGRASVDCRVGLDGDGRWIPYVACVRYASGVLLERFHLHAVRDEVGACLRTDSLAAVGEALTVAPDETLAAALAINPTLDDEILATGVERVVDGLEMDPRMRRRVEALDDMRREGEPSTRERLDGVARGLRRAATGHRTGF